MFIYYDDHAGPTEFMIIKSLPTFYDYHEILLNHFYDFHKIFSRWYVELLPGKHEYKIGASGALLYWEQGNFKKSSP